MKEEEAKCVSLPFCYMENYVKLPAGAKLQCFADFGGSASGLSPLFAFYGKKVEIFARMMSSYK